jgi:hypothetical protein
VEDWDLSRRREESGIFSSATFILRCFGV